MKKLLFSLLIAIGAFTSCNNEVDDIFDKSASDRLNEALAEYSRILISAPNGWMMEYYPNSNQSHGGFTVLLDFDTASEVTVCSEIGSPVTTVETSLWSLDKSNSIVLNLDSYNSLLHYFADPDQGGGSDMGGDFMFMFTQTVSEEKIILSGIKSKSRIVMTPIPETTSWETLIKEVSESRKNITSKFVSRYYLNEIELTDGDSYAVMSIPETDSNILENNPNATIDFPYMYTPTGIKFYENKQLSEKLGIIYPEFTWDAANLTYTCVQDPSVVLQGWVYDNLVKYEDYLGNWKMTYKNGSGRTSSMNITLKEGEDTNALSPLYITSEPLPNMGYPEFDNMTLRFEMQKSLNALTFVAIYAQFDVISGGNKGRVVIYLWDTNENMQVTNGSIKTEVVSTSPLTLKFVENTTAVDKDGNPINYINGLFFAFIPDDPDVAGFAFERMTEITMTKL